MLSRYRFLIVLGAFAMISSACRKPSGSQVASLQPQVIIETWLRGYCPKESRLDWSAIKSRSRVIGSIAGKDSGILADDGTRQIRQLEIEDCDGKGTAVVFRFTLDRAGGADGAELFIKNKSTNEVAAFALSLDGQELREVPRELATDKHGNKLNGGDDIIRTRLGCAECHARVSTEYDMPGASEFWRNARIVARWRLEEAGDQSGGAASPASDLPPDVDRIEGELDPNDNSPSVRTRDRINRRPDANPSRRLESSPSPRPSPLTRPRSRVYRL